MELDLRALNWKPNVMAGDLCPFCHEEGQMQYADHGEDQYERCCGCGKYWQHEVEAATNG